MADVKINVGAGVQGVEAAIGKITASMNKLGAAVAKSQGGLKFEDTTTKLMARDLSLLNRQFEQAIKLSAGLRNALKNSGQAGVHISQIDWSKTSADPRIAARFRDRAFSFAVRGTSLDPTLTNEVDEQGNAIAPAPAPSGDGGSAGSGGGGRSGGGGGGRRPPRGGDVGARRPSLARRTFGGFGRGLGGAAGGAIEEGAGAVGGLGAMGAAAGGFLIAQAAMKAGEMVSKFVSEGMDSAKIHNGNLDTLKRQLGDSGISPEDLSSAAWNRGQGLGMANGDFVNLELQANAASGGAYTKPDDLAEATRSGAELGRAYGVGTDQGVSFVAGMQRLNQRQDNKQLARDLAEAIVNAQGKATPGEVMQYMQSFAAAQNRFNSGSIDLNRWGNAFGSMLDGDMTADHAASIIGQANSAMQKMGGTEASRNFTMQAFGTLDPVRAAMRAEGGLFGNGLDNPSIGGYMRAHGARGWDDMDRGPGGTNFSVMRGAFDRAYAGRGAYGAEMELDAEKNYFGLKSYADTAALMGMSDSAHSALSDTLKNAGVSLKDLREGGLQTITGFMKASTFGDLDKLYKSRDNRDLQPDEIAAISKAEGTGDRQPLLNELVRVFSGKGMEDTDATRQQNIDANIADMKTQIGEKLIPFTQAIMQAGIAVANKIPGIHVQDPTADGGAMFMGPPGSAASATHYGISHKPVVGLHTAAGNTALDKLLDGTATFANETYGATVGGAYSVNSDVRGGMSQLMGLGVDKPHAAAIMASAIRESSMNPDAKNGNMYGLFQFDRARQADFKRVMGKDIHGTSASEQIDYMVKSMQAGGEEAAPGKEFWASSAKDAAGVFARRIERTDHPGKESDIRSGIAGELQSERYTVAGTAARAPAKSPHSDDHGEKLPNVTAADLIVIPPAKIPEKDAAAAAANAASKTDRPVPHGSEGGTRSGSASQNSGDINITLQQTISGPGGQSKTKTLTTKVSKPAAQGLDPNPTIIQIPR